MNILEVKPVETFVLKVRDPNTGDYLSDGKKPVTITLKGMHTDAFQQELIKQRTENERNAKRGITLSAAQERTNSAKLYAAVTVEWAGIDGECTKSNAQAIYEPESMSWLRSQISDALIEHAQSLKK